MSPHQRTVDAGTQARTAREVKEEKERTMLDASTASVQLFGERIATEVAGGFPRPVAADDDRQ